MSDLPNNTVYTPRNAQRIEYVKACDCRDATSSTGRMSVNLTPGNVEGAAERHIDFRVAMVDHQCDECGTPYIRDIVEWVPGSEEEAEHGARVIRGELALGGEGILFWPDADVVPESLEGMRVALRPLTSEEVEDEEDSSDGGGPQLVH